MVGPEFFQTQMGRRFFESQLPNLTKAINRLADVKEAELALAKGKVEKHRMPEVNNLHDEICELLNRYETGSGYASAECLYIALRKVRDHWSEIVGNEKS